MALVTEPLVIHGDGRGSMSVARLAAEWSVDAIGRGPPITVNRRYEPVTDTRAGKWYVLEGDERRGATFLEARALNKVIDRRDIAEMAPIAAAN